MPEESNSNRNKEQKQIAGKRELKEQPERSVFCPNCGNEVELIWVHGHYQCPICKNVVVSCCEGESD